MPQTHGIIQIRKVCLAHAITESKSRPAGWDGFGGSSLAAAVLLLQIFFFSPAKNGNAVKIWLLWDAASLGYSWQAFCTALRPHRAGLQSHRKLCLQAVLM